MSGRTFTSHLSLWCLAIHFLGPVSADAQTYSILDLGTLGGSQSSGAGINNAGQAVGYSYTDSSNLIFHATLWSGGTATDLGTLGGKLSYATGINDAGSISGASEDLTDYHPVVWNGATQTQLGTSGNSVASGINNAGQVVGTSTGHRATIWNGTVPTYLHDAPSDANGINNAGEIVGNSTNADSGAGDVATVWNGSTTTQLGGSGAVSIGYGINDTGQVAGFIRAGNSIVHAALWNGTTPTDLGTLGGNSSIAAAINNGGQVTGRSDTSAAIWTPSGTVVDSAAFLYSNGRMTDLNTLIDAGDPLNQKVILIRGSGLNQNGWIIADGTELSTGNRHAYLVVPVRFLPRTLTFANQPVGVQSTPQPVAITNTGAHPFAVTSISATAGFSQLNDCPISLQPGDTCSVRVTFSPVAANSQSGHLYITSGAAVLTVALSGSAFIPIALRASAASVAVGMPVTLTWASTSLATCSATGGATGDGWAGDIASSGTKSVTESSTGEFTYMVKCAIAGTSVQQQVAVTVTLRGGGGALGGGLLVALFGMIGFRFAVRRVMGEPLRLLKSLALAVGVCWLVACATKGPTIPLPPGEPPKVRLGPLFQLFELKANDFALNVRAIVDSAGQAHVLVGCDIKRRTETYEVIVGNDAVLDRRFIASAQPRFVQSTNSIPWDAIDGAYDAHGVLHALVGDRHFVFVDGRWQASTHTPWQEAHIDVESARFVRGAPGLIWALELKGKDVGAHARWDLWGFGNALGGVIWPWRTHGTRTVIVPEIESDYPSWAVLDPQGKKDTLMMAAAADAQSNVQVLYSKARSGLFSDNNQNGMPSPVMEEVYHARLSAHELAMGATEPPERSQKARETRQLRTFAGRLQRAAWSPVSLAVDPTLGTALVGTQWRVKSDEWSGPLKGSVVGYGRVASAGGDQFHAIVVGNGLTDWRTHTKDIPLLYMLLSGQEWSASVELGVASARDVLGFMPDKIDIANAQDGRAFVVWPTREGVMGRWIEAVP